MKIENNKFIKKAIIIGASSDIGRALCDDWIGKNWEVTGTYRTNSDQVKALSKNINETIHCDLLDSNSIDDACSKLSKLGSKWDVLVLGPGLQEPVDLFHESNFEEWEQSIKVNFTSQLRILHRLLASRNSKCLTGPNVLFFAGGGVNNAPVNYSAYTVSKVALIKMVELLASEIPDVKFLIIGPGWVKTKIHKSIINAGDRAGASYQKTIKTFLNNDFTPMSKVVECCNILILGSRKILSGRNYSIAFDGWQDNNFEDFLQSDSNLYKLRRYGNNLKSK